MEILDVETGHVSKEDAFNDLCEAIRSVYSGETYLSFKVSDIPLLALRNYAEKGGD